MIKLLAIGHLGKDCVVNEVNGKSVINFSVAHSEKFKDSQGVQREKTIWVNCSYWPQSTKISEYLKKGTQVFVEGEPSVNTYTNNQGQAVPQLNLIVRQITLLSSSKEQTGGGVNFANYAHSTTTVSRPQENKQPEDDLPF